MQKGQDSLMHHPPSLRVFFATEMWERYGFYVVQTLLALYLALHLKWPDKKVYELAATFTGLTYLSPIIGGWIADHLLGQKRAVLLGAVFLFFSYSALTLVTTPIGLISALAGVAVGTGLLKPNISSLLGNEYPASSPKRESGFTIFYMGITTGIILGTILPSNLQEHYGWPVTFTSAAIGMIFAFAVFAYGIYRYKIADYHPYEFSMSKLVKAIAMMLMMWLAAFIILNYPLFADTAFVLVVLMSLSYLIYSVMKESTAQARQTAVIGLLCFISMFFWAFYFQMFLSLTIFIKRVVDPTFLGINFPPPYYVGVQSFGMILFGYFLSRSKPQLTLAQSGIRTGNKFMLAMLLMNLAFALIALIAYYTTVSSTLLSPLYFIPVYLIFSVAELLLSPVGLSAITVLACRKKVSTMMGIFFVSLGLGAFLAGKVADLTSVVQLESLSLIQLKAHYSQTFTVLFFILLAANLVCFILILIIRSLLNRHSQAEGLAAPEGLPP